MVKNDIKNGVIEKRNFIRITPRCYSPLEANSIAYKLRKEKIFFNLFCTFSYKTKVKLEKAVRDMEELNNVFIKKLSRYLLYYEIGNSVHIHLLCNGDIGLRNWFTDTFNKITYRKGYVYCKYYKGSVYKQSSYFCKKGKNVEGRFNFSRFIYYNGKIERPFSCYSYITNEIFDSLKYYLKIKCMVSVKVKNYEKFIDYVDKAFYKKACYYIVTIEKDGVYCFIFSPVFNQLLFEYIKQFEISFFKVSCFNDVSNFDILLHCLSTRILKNKGDINIKTYPVNAKTYRLKKLYPYVKGKRYVFTLMLQDTSICAAIKTGEILRYYIKDFYVKKVNATDCCIMGYCEKTFKLRWNFTFNKGTLDNNAIVPIGSVKKF